MTTETRTGLDNAELKEWRYSLREQIVSLDIIKFRLEAMERRVLELLGESVAGRKSFADTNIAPLAKGQIKETGEVNDG